MTPNQMQCHYSVRVAVQTVTALDSQMSGQWSRLQLLAISLSQQVDHKQ